MSYIEWVDFQLNYWSLHLCSISGQCLNLLCYTVEPWYIEGPRDWQNFVHYNKVLFHNYILLLLGQNKSFVIPRTSLYYIGVRYNKVQQFTVVHTVLKVNTIFHPLVLYGNDGISVYFLNLAAICLFSNFSSVSYFYNRLSFYSNEALSNWISSFAPWGEGEILRSITWISKPIFSCIEIAMACW